MISKPIMACTFAAFLSAGAIAEKPADKSSPKPSATPRLPQNDRSSNPVPTPIRIVPTRNTPAPAISAPAPSKSTPAPAPPSDPAPGGPPKAGDEDKSRDQEKDQPPEKKAKGPTVITSRQAKFDQRANLAIFIGDVFVDDPEFKVHCDKLTAYLMHDDAPKPAAATPGKPGVKPAATPAPAPGATPAPATKKKGGLEKAVAESTTGQRVLINQDKTEADGTVTHGIGHADKATYDAVTGDVVLSGSPEVFQGPKSVVAIDPAAIITLNRDGHMHTQGMTKTTIDNAGDAR